MQISEFAQRCSVTPHALRHYEQLGLLKPHRRASGYRDYPEAMRREVVFITMSRQVGFSLTDIAEQIPAFRIGRLSTHQMVVSLQQRVDAIDQQVTDLAVQRAQALSHIQWLKAQKRPAAHSPFPKPKTRTP